MTMTVEIPPDLQPLVEDAIAKGAYANEQELVAEILRIAAPALEGYRQLKADVRQSLKEEKAQYLSRLPIEST